MLVRLELGSSSSSALASASSSPAAYIICACKQILESLRPSCRIHAGPAAAGCAGRFLVLGRHGGR